MAVLDRVLYARARLKLRAIGRAGSTAYAGMQSLIDAEVAAHHKRYAAAETCYEAAIEQLQQSEFLGLRAACMECAGRFYLGRQLRSLGQPLMRVRRSFTTRGGLP